jgi:hypothetical protein
MADNGKKLMLHKANKAVVLNAPDGYEELIGPMPEGMGVSTELAAGEEGSFDFVMLFAGSIAQLDEFAPEVIRATKPGGYIWIAYPKKSSKIKTDINRDIGWKPMVDAGIVPVTQISLDETWSALRFRPVTEIKVMSRKSLVPGADQ